MKYDEFVNLLEEARATKQTALEKLEDALQELYSAEAKMDAIWASLPETGDTQNWGDIDDQGNILEKIFSPVKGFADMFGFGDLF